MNKKNKNKNFTMIFVCEWIASVVVALCAITAWPMGIHNILFFLCAVIINPVLFNFSYKKIFSINQKKLKIVQVVSAVLLFLLGMIFWNVLKNHKNSDSDTQNTSNTIITQDDSKKLEVYFLDVGQADCILIRYDNKNVLIDAGKKSTANKLTSFLKSLGIEKFSYVVGTHPHEDHIGGFPKIINSFEIEEILMTKTDTTTPTFEKTVDAIKQKKQSLQKQNENLINEKNLKCRCPEEGEEFNIGECKFKVLAVGNDSNNVNASSIVLKLSFGEKSFLFTGDATAETEEKILNNKKITDVDIKSDVLKVGHHGSAGSSSENFLKKVQPLYAVISVGVENKYGHPSKKICERLLGIGTKIYRTDEYGTILITCDKKNISIMQKETHICKDHEIAHFEEIPLRSQDRTETSENTDNVDNIKNDENTLKSENSGSEKENSQNDEKIVYIPVKWKKYHRKGCKKIKKINEAREVSKDEAEREGYSPCLVCNPAA